MKAFLKKIKRKVLFLSQLYYKFAKYDVECNVCRFKAKSFRSDYWQEHVICPNCGSDVKQRLLVATLTLLDDFSFEKLIDGKSILHFAPEKAMGSLFKSHAGSYATADYLAQGYSYEDIDFKIDISDMPSIRDESFDCLIACDVLEHVPKHIKGIKEAYRVLKKGGHCIFTVPQRDGLAITYEDPAIVDPNDRERAYGQFDHLRIYGDDFSSLLEQCGFRVSAIDESFFPKELAEKYVLFPPIPSQKNNATNFRKIFIGAK